MARSMKRCDRHLICNKAILVSKDLCLAVSKALEKSSPITIANGSVAMRSVVVCSRAMSAEVVDPVGPA